MKVNTESVFTNALPRYVYAIAEKLTKNGYQVFVVGGAVRDILLGNKPKEFDMATDAHPQAVREIFSRTVPTGIKHGTILVLEAGGEVELTTFRSDGNYSDGRHPDEIHYADSIEEDVSRRDFTINAMAYDIQKKNIIDLFGGKEDLAGKLVRTVGEPHERFREDGLRVMRACRFSAKLSFAIETKTFRAIAECKDVFAKVSVERVREELNGILASSDPVRGIETMRTAGILAMVLPELEGGFGVEQNRFHAYDVYYHNLYTCAAVESGEDEHTTALMRLAGLLHDVAKPVVKKKVKEDEDDVFYNHEVVGAAITRKIMRRLKYSNADIKFVDNLIRNHMFYYRDEWTDGAVRRFMRKVGLENIKPLIALRDADRIGNGKKRRGESEAIKKLLRRIDTVIEEENAMKVTDLAIDGDDLMREFDLKPGQIIGKTLNYLLECVLDEPALNEYDTLKEKARTYIEEEGGRDDSHN